MVSSPNHQSNASKDDTDVLGSAHVAHPPLLFLSAWTWKRIREAALDRRMPAHVQISAKISQGVIYDGSSQSAVRGFNIHWSKPKWLI